MNFRKTRVGEDSTPRRRPTRRVMLLALVALTCATGGVVARGQWTATIAGDPVITRRDNANFRAAAGPDLFAFDLWNTTRFGRVGDITAYGVGVRACNVGDANVNWFASTNQHPVFVQNMYRLKDGRFEQIGMSWAFHLFFSVNDNSCGACVDPGSASLLGVGCSDPISAPLAGSQGGLALRSDINAWTGIFPYPWTAPAAPATIGRRLQVHDADIDPDLNAGASYFVEGQYIAPDDATAGNSDNNASYSRIGVSEPLPDEFEISSPWATAQEQPAIRAWQDNDASVEETDIRVPGEGLFILASKVTNLDGNVWHYEYAIQNTNSDRSARAFSVLIPDGLQITNVGFHDVDYHSGEIYDGTDWTYAVAGGQLTWSTDEYAADPNANALRFGTLYNFRFDADSSPIATSVLLGLFKPGTPTSVFATSVGPSPVSYVDASALSTHDGTSWCEAFLSLQDALTVAVPGTTIRVADGTYMPDGGYIPDGGAHVPGTADRAATFQLITGVTIEGGYAGCGAPDPDARDIAANETILSGDVGNDDVAVPCTQDSQCTSNGDLCANGTCIIKSNNSENSYHVVTGSGTDASSTLDGFIVTAGHANGSGLNSLGAGMYNLTASPTVMGCVFRGNLSSFSGGGVSNGSGSNSTFTSCVFSANSTTFNGGGMYNEWSNPNLSDCSFTNNSSTRGGGIANWNSSPTVVNCLFSSNVASGQGGGWYIDATSNGSPDVVNCVFTGNFSAGDGGAMYNVDRVSPTVTNCTFSRNTAMQWGGGVASRDNGFTPDVTLTNCVFWGNTDSGGTTETSQILDDCEEVCVTAQVDYCLIEGWTGLRWGVGNRGGNPLFIDADGLDNIPGTEDDDLRLQSGSPAIDAASTPDVPADTLDLDNDGDTAEPTPFDLDGNIRLVDDWLTPDTGVPGSPVVDMGAYEFYRDCNENGAPDSEDMGLGASGDCNSNNIPDECDIANGTSLDCNFNGVPDDCDIISGFSLDVDPVDGVPDECDPFTATCVPPDDDAWSCSDNWPIPGDLYPDDVSSAAGEHVKIAEPSDVRLDVTVQVPSVEIGEGATLRVTETSGIGDLNFSSPAVLVIEGTLLVAGDRAIGSGGLQSPTVILGESWGPSGIYKADSGAANTAAAWQIQEAVTVSASLTADSITMSDTAPCLTTEQITLTDQMTVTTAGDFIMDGSQAVVSCSVCAMQTASVLGGRTPPILIFRGSASVAVGGDFLMLGSANILNDSTGGISIAGNFDNRSLMPECFDSNAGTFIFDGSGDQKFEVAGRDLGSSLFCDADDSNFTIGTVQIGTDTAGADVRFVNEHFNTVASGSCLEALYVGDLILKAGSHVTFDNCRVYYGNLIAGVGATMSNEGCGEAISLNNPETPILEPSVADIGFGTRMRYLSFSGGTPGTSQAVRVQFDIGNGPETMWVQEPFRMAEASGVAVDGEPGFWAANLGCIPDFADWTQWDSIHVLDESIIPSQSYDIALVAEGCESSEAAFSAPLAVDTSKWGDAVTACVGGVCGSPNGDSNFDDIAAVVDKFRNLPGAPKKSQADVVPSALDFNVDFGDIPAVVDGFRGLPYPYTPPVDPCP